jgi:hypothetical protein
MSDDPPFKKDLQKEKERRAARAKKRRAAQVELDRNSYRHPHCQRFGGQGVHEQMMDVLAGWPGTEEYDAAVGEKAAEEADSKKGSDGGKASGDKRRKEPSPNPIIDFITKKLKRDRDISGCDMVAALKAEAENGLADGHIIMSADGTAFVVMDNAKEKNRLATTSVPATVSRLRKKISKCA